MRVVAIVQARMGSSRLPGKVLLPVGQRVMLEQVLHQLSRARLVDAAVVATSVDLADDPIAQWATAHRVTCCRGSLTDVLDRFRQAAAEVDADAVVRVTADCPLLDPEVVDCVVAAYRAAHPAVDYASNVLERTYPRGLDTEVFSRAALEQAARAASRPHEREHVTPYLYENPTSFRLLSVRNEVNLSRYRLTVDTPEDLALVRAVLSRVGGEVTRWQDVVELLAREPALVDLNRRVEQKPLH
ncbi:MAG: glycosyltransferase family protein [Deltaproteobacteria bacterium]|nr:glycosyltransferase family protein [Deltaproteobacteria bacterium]